MANLINKAYAGPEDVAGANANRPQIQEIEDRFCPDGTPLPARCAREQMPKIDALLVTVGGNDIGFGDIIAQCVKDDTELVTSTCSEDSNFVNGVNRFLTNLNNFDPIDQDHPTYGMLAAKLNELNYANVFINEYPDPTTFVDTSTTNTDGTHPVRVCDKFILEDAVSDHSYGLSPLLLPGKSDGLIGHTDLMWAQSIVNQLDGAVATAASAFGWSYVGGVSSKFQGYGYCAYPHFIIHRKESMDTQLNENGTMHPNQTGQIIYAQQIVQALFSKGIGLPNTSSFIPTGSVLTSGISP